MNLGAPGPFLAILLLNVDALNECPFSAFRYNLLCEWPIESGWLPLAF